MKKLIGILASVSLVATSSAVVVSCKSKVERYDHPSINRDAINKLLAKITGNNDDYSIDVLKYYSDDQLVDKAVAIINDYLGLKNGYDKTNSLLSTLGNKVSKYENIDAYKSKYNSVSNSVAENKLFDEYTKSLQDNSPMDYTQSENLYSLNVKKEIKAGEITVYNGTETAKNDKPIPVGASILYGESKKPWITAAEYPSTWDKEKTDNIPTIKELTSEYAENGKHIFWVTDSDGKTPLYNISATTAITLRFQDYFENKLINDLNETKMVMSNIFQFYRASGDELYLDSLNPLFSNTQDWNDNNVSQAWNTNFKMVWAFQYDKTKDTKVKEELSKAKDIFKEISDTGLSSFTLLNNKKIKDIVTTLKTATGVDEVTDKSAFDPYFGIGGFKGYTFEKDSTKYGENTLSDKYKTQVANYNGKGPGLVYNNATQFGFDDEKDDTKCNVVIVLPVYLANILAPTDNAATTFTIKDANDKVIPLNIATGKSDSGNKNNLFTIWNNDTNTNLHSKDIDDLDSSKKTSFINQMISMLASNEEIQKQAKTKVYSKYLNEDDIYYSGLWDKIGSFIHKRDEDEDM